MSYSDILLQLAKRSLMLTVEPMFVLKLSMSTQGESAICVVLVSKPLSSQITETKTTATMWNQSF